jgi:hypothetical protein
MKLNYHLCLRQSTGFMKGMFVLVGMSGLLIPDYSTLCRRQKSLPIEIGERLKRGENLVVGIDSTGLKVYGEGEWKVRKHGFSKHRTWRKLHICIDLDTQEILAAELTTNGENDAPVGKQMLSGKTVNISTFHGDGAYDDNEFREFLGKEIQPIIPPPKNAIVSPPKKTNRCPTTLLNAMKMWNICKNTGLKNGKLHTVITNEV